MNNRKRQKEESRERILKAAADLFRKDGYEATGIDAVMENAGLTAGTFYAHFKSKRHLLAETLKYAFSQSFSNLTLNMEDIPPQERVQILIKRYLSIAHRDYPQKGCPLVGLASELARQDEEVGKIVAHSIEKIASWIAENLTELPPAERLNHAMAMVSAAVGSLLLSRLTKGTLLSEQFLNCSKQII